MNDKNQEDEKPLSAQLPLEIQTAVLFERYLSKKVVHFDGDNARIVAEAAASDIGRQHRALISRLAKWFKLGPGDQGEVIVNGLQHLIMEGNKTVIKYTIVESDNGVDLVLEVSFLSEQKVSMLINELDVLRSSKDQPAYTQAETVYNLVAAYLSFNSQIVNPGAIAFGVPQKYAIDFAVARIAAVAVKSGNEAAMQVALDQTNLMIEDMTERTESLSTSIESATNISQGLIESHSATSAKTDQLVAVVDKTVQRYHELIGPMNEAIESNRLKAIRELWGRRENQYLRALVIGVILLAIAFILPVVGIIQYHTDLLELLSRIETDSIKAAGSDRGQFAATISAIGRIAIIGTPFGLYVWIIRILVRYFTRSMVLLDDARQRVTTMDTYLSLVAENVVEHQDRAIVLEALFRRAPGQGPDTLEPANLSDMMNIVSGKPKAD